MRALLLIATLAVSICSVAGKAAANSNSCEREMVRASTKYGVPLGMLYSVGLAETGKRGSLQPYAMNIEGKPYFAANASDAMRRFEDASRDGAKLIDLGCMQINHHFHREKFSSLASMLNPHDNVDYAAQFLKQLRVREGSWTMAVARYHAGPNNNPAQKQYVCRVVANMVASGFGEWTPTARSFCQ
ncbi:transglycosylase SLT domain-containing protein [Microvirga sp. 2MCAF38]|uniref:transglycosylase SLT domain-containing protein n=1 Tax=Microvirga sp. 2MCAF38 TaxID=3232989 RepID=UPI003F9EB180